VYEVIMVLRDDDFDYVYKEGFFRKKASALKRKKKLKKKHKHMKVIMNKHHTED